MAERLVFTRKTILLIFVAGVLSFLGAAYVSVYQDEFEPGRTVGANAFSYSAIGHRAFVRLLERLDVPLTVSRFDSAGKASRSGALVLAEPRFEQDDLGQIRDYLDADRVLIVLPKWFGLTDPANPRWIGYLGVLKPESVEKLLRELIPGATVERAATPGNWTVNAIGVAPDLDEAQLIRAPRLKPLVASSKGILLGEITLRGSRVWILSDPDVLANHGIAKGANADFMARVIDIVRDGGRVVLDETSHGFKVQRNLWKAMFEHPFLFVTIQALAALLVLLGAIAVRFGAPERAAPPLAPGKGMLIANTADLLHFGGHDGEIVRRYAAATVRTVARRLHAPRHLHHEPLYRWLDRIAQNRKIGISVAALAAEADALTAGGGGAIPRMTRLTQFARRLHRWKQEMMDGSAGHRDAQPKP